MTVSPDLSQLMDLRPFDMDPYQISQRAFDVVTAALEGNYAPLKADVDVVLIEALAREIMDLVIAANRSVYASIHGVLTAYGVPWNPGAYATTVLRFTGLVGTTIPIGVESQVRLSTGDDLVFATTAAGTIGGSGYIDLAAQCTVRTALANRVPIGTLMQPSVGIYSIESTAVQSVVVGGMDPESLTDYYTRVGNRLGRITDSLVLPTHFSNAALEQPFVQRAVAIDEWNGIDITSAGEDVNYITVAVLGAAGALLTSGQKLTIKQDLMARSVTALATVVIDAVVQPITVIATLRALPGADLTAVHDNAIAALQTFLSSDTAAWGMTIQPNDIIELLGRDVDGADVVLGEIVPADPLTLGPITLPALDLAGTDITVVAP